MLFLFFVCFSSAAPTVLYTPPCPPFPSLPPLPSFLPCSPPALPDLPPLQPPLPPPVPSPPYRPASPHRCSVPRPAADARSRSLLRRRLPPGLRRH
ncbi:hypothetical protein CCS92_34000, partial [Methylobacterium radiotolerans]